MAWKFSSALNIGDRKDQQDRVAIFHSEDRGEHLIVLADGMGGHRDGSAAAQTVIDIASDQFNSGHIENPRKFLEKICLDAHDAILLLGEDRERAPGSTCVILYLKNSEAYWVHVGDSRLYHLRDNSFIHRTSDHSVAQLVTEQKDDSKEKTENAVPQNQLYMCLGGSGEVLPEFRASNVESGDFILLCSDGLWDQVNIENLFLKIEPESLDQEYTEKLVELAKQQGKGKSDNISIAWAYCQGGFSKRGISSFLKRLTGQRP